MDGDFYYIMGNNTKINKYGLVQLNQRFLDISLPQIFIADVKEARRKLSSLLDRVERGEEIIITRRGKKIAHLVSTEREKTLPSLKQFRASISSTGKPLSETVVDMRYKERY